MAHRCRSFYEGQSARTSILAGATAPRPDTLTQTGQIASHKPLADGAGHTFFNHRARDARIQLLRIEPLFVKRSTRSWLSALAVLFGLPEARRSGRRGGLGNPKVGRTRSTKAVRKPGWSVVLLTLSLGTLLVGGAVAASFGSVLWDLWPRQRRRFDSSLKIRSA